MRSICFASQEVCSILHTDELLVQFREFRAEEASVVSCSLAKLLSRMELTILILRRCLGMQKRLGSRIVGRP